jgi:hypothetical protein
MIRRDFRHEIVNRLINHTPAGDRVFASRVLPVFSGDIKNKVPFILVYTNTTRDEIYNESPRIYQEVTATEVQIASPMIERLDDALDVFGALVRRILLTDETLGGVVDTITPTGAKSGNATHGEQEFGGLILYFDVAYYFQMPDKITVQDMDDLRSVYTAYRLNIDQPEDDWTHSAVTGLGL